MNILLISPEYPPRSIGGGGIVYKSLCEELQNRGHSVKVLAGNFENSNIVGKIEVSDCGVNLSFVPLLPHPNLKKANSASYTPPTPRGLLYIIKTLIKNKNAIVHLHGFCHPIVDSAAFACMALRRKYLITCHGIPVNPKTFKSPARALFNLYLSTIERFVVRNAMALTTVSNSLRNECADKKLLNKKVLVIPNGANKSLTDITPGTVETVEKHYSLQGKYVIFALGRLSENKGFQYLIQTMHNVVASIPNAVAIIAGSGPFKQHLENLIIKEGLSDKVKLVGWVNEEVKAALYKRSDAVVFPSLNEPFGMVMLEALQLHKPLIAFRTETAQEVLMEGTALLVPTGNALELGNAIIKVATDTELKEKLSNIAIDNVFGWDKIVNQYINAYSESSQLVK